MGNYSIRVIYDNGHAAANIKVFVSYGTFGGHDKDYTDSDGWVEFENYDNDTASFIIEGVEYEDYDVSDGSSYSFTI